MKYLLIIFFTFSSVANAQIIGVVGNGQFKSKTSGNVTPPPTDTTPPTAPSSLVVSNIGETTATLTWTASTDANGISYYRIYNNNVSIVTSTGSNATTYNLTGLSPNTSYTITVRGVDPFSNISSNSNSQTFTTDAASAYASTRFIMMGDSWTYSMYTGSLEAQAVSRINAQFPNEVVTVHNEGSPGQSLNSYASSYVTSALARYNYDPSIDTYCVVMLGVNDARVATYASLTQTEINNKIAALNTILNAIEAKGFKPVLVEAGFTSFKPSASFPSGFGPAYPDESLGTKPYNDNIIIPAILGRASTSQYAYADGQSFYQPYVLLYNGYPEYDGWDGVHPADDAYAALKQGFVDRLVSYIFTGVPPTKIAKEGEAVVVNNLQEEQDYFNATLLTVANKSQLQTYLNTYGSVRLESGDYSGTAVTLTSNMKLYGHPSMTSKMPNLNIAAGSTNVLVQNMFDNEGYGINFNSGSPITNCILKNANFFKVQGTNVQLQDNQIINFKGFVDLDCASSGYLRNNKFIRYTAQGGDDQITLLGNSTTPSYGNIQVFTNHLTPNGDSGLYDNLQSHTFIGLDAEGWNLTGTGANGAMLKATNIGDMKISSLGGDNGYSEIFQKAYDIEADNSVVILNDGIINQGGVVSNVSGTADLMIIQQDGGGAKSYTGSGIYLGGHEGNQDVDVNEVPQTALITNSTTITDLTNLIKGTEHMPYARPVWETLPNPLPSTWATDRVGQTDQASYIQGLINANGKAQLPEGIFYIGSSLTLNSGQGIIGSGTGKTVLVGLNDTFPLIVLNGGASATVSYTVTNMTLQGGSDGINVPTATYQLSGCNFAYLVFREQSVSGFHLEKCYALDNSFMDNVNFVDCPIGFFQDPDSTPASGDRYSDTAYVDKVVFYNCQFINNGVALSMLADRPDNLNLWIDCKFDNNGLAMDAYYHNFTTFVNCDFTNHTGVAVMKSANSPFLLHNCEFSSNSTTNVFANKGNYIEGCNFLDNIPLNATTVNYNSFWYIMNSTITGTLGKITEGMLVNNSIPSVPAYSKLLVNIKNSADVGQYQVLLDAASDPYPQFYVKH